MTTRLYPKKHETNRHLDRRWRLDAELVYDHGASTWSWGYRTRLTARLAAWWHHNIASYGGSITLTDTEPR